MNVRYTDTALAEIDEICSYIAQDNPDAAADVAAAIERTVALIGKRPKSAPVVYAGEVRARLVERFQYRVFCEPAGRGGSGASGPGGRAERGAPPPQGMLGAGRQLRRDAGE